MTDPYGPGGPSQNGHGSDDVLRTVVLPKLDGIRKSGAGYEARCPAHEDNRASLTVAVGRDQPVVFDCKAGCDPEDVVRAMGLSWADLSKQNGHETRFAEWTPRGEAIAVYDYRDEADELLYQVLRTADKQFPQRVPDATKRSGFRWQLGNVRRVLYRLSKVIAAVAAGEVIYVVEGEKDVHALERLGVVATCNSGGAGKWRPEFAEVLRDAVVFIIADKDPAGQKHARQVMASVKETAGAVEIYEPTVGKDISDHLSAGKTLADLECTCRDEDYAPDLAPDLYEFLAVDDPPEVWVIKGLLERGDRMLWTGEEGLGKSTLVRQLAVAAAAGLLPFDDETQEPMRVLFIDCENTVRRSRKRFRQLERVARSKGHPVPEGGLRIIHRLDGVDVSREDDMLWLIERVTAHKPDLVVIGPLYKLHRLDIMEELAALAIIDVLDKLVLKADCSLIVEAHPPHGASDASRPLRPYGASALKRFPDFGMGLRRVPKGGKKLVRVEDWRGPREEYAWPFRLTWGNGTTDWPWIRWVAPPAPTNGDGPDKPGGGQEPLFGGKDLAAGEGRDDNLINLAERQKERKKGKRK